MRLAEQLKHLDRVLLGGITTQFPDPLTDEEKASLNAFIVLTHAVLEEHLEAAFKSQYQRLRGWVDGSMVPLEVVRLAFAVGRGLPENKTASYKTRTIGGVLKAGEAVVDAAIRGNHGIKPHHVRSLAEAVGVEWPSLEAELNSALLDLDTLANHRGEAGHLSPYSSAASKITHRTDPEDVRKWVSDARDAVLAICEYLRLLIDGQQPLSLIVDWDGN